MFTAATRFVGTPPLMPSFTVPSLLYIDAQSGDEPCVLPPHWAQKW